MKIKKILNQYAFLIKKSCMQWHEDNAQRLGAALAFYTILSLAPLLVLALVVAGFLFSYEEAQGKLIHELQGIVGKSGAGAIRDMLANAAAQKSTGIFATIFGILTLLFGASGVFGELKEAMNSIWHLKTKNDHGVLGFIKSRFFSLIMVIGTIFLLLFSLIINTTITVLTHSTLRWFADFAFLINMTNFIISFGILTCVFALIFKYLPDAQIAWRDIWLGAGITALLFTFGKYLISLYLAQSSFSSSYGAAGSLVVILVWVYYSAQILFLGAEFTHVYANYFGDKIKSDF